MYLELLNGHLKVCRDNPICTSLELSTLELEDEDDTGVTTVRRSGSMMPPPPLPQGMTDF